MAFNNKLIVIIVLMLVLPMTLFPQSKRDVKLSNKYLFEKDLRQKWGKAFFHPCEFQPFEFPNVFHKSQSDAILTQWECLGPEGGNVNDMVFDPTNPAIIYAARANNPGLIFKTTDAGQNWSMVGVVKMAVHALVIDPNDPTKLYAGGNDRMFYESTDGGANWVGYQFSQNDDWIYSLAVHPTNSNIFYAGADYRDGSSYKMAVMKSTNGGKNWQVTSFGTDNGAGYAIAIDPQHPDTVFVGGYGDQSAKIYKTVDGGTNWSEMNTGSIGSSVNSLTVHPTNNAVVFAGTSLRLHKSTNGGKLWNVSGGFPANDLTVDPHSPDIIYAGSNGEIYKSTDGGDSWNGTSGGMPMANVNVILNDPTAGNIIYAGGQLGILKSVNGGTNWTVSNSGLIAAVVTELQVSRTNPDIIYIAIDNDALYKSEDKGQSWIRLEEFEGCDGIIDLAVAPNSSDTLYVLSGG